MPSYFTPGVYYERIDATAPAISAVRTDVAGFVGLAERGPLDTPVPVQSWRQFEAHFGSFTGFGFLAYAVRGFFENGGRRCWVVRAASNDPAGGAQSAFVDLTGAATARDIWRVAASSPGMWGNGLTISLRETRQVQTTGWLDKDDPSRMIVASTAGIGRGTLLRLTQPGAPAVLRVAAGVDSTQGFASVSPAARKYIVWTPEDPRLRLPYDASQPPLAGGTPIAVESIEYTLVVEQQGIPMAIYRGLALIPEHPRYGPELLGPIRIAADVQSRQTLPPLPQPVLIEELRDDYTPELLVITRPLEAIQPPPENSPLAGGRSGLRLLTTYDLIGEAVDPLDSDLVKAAKTRGLRALEEIEEVSMLAVPDVHIQPVEIPPVEPPPPCVPDPCLPGAPPATVVAAPPIETETPPVFGDAEIYRVQAAMVEQCRQTKSRVALLDAPFSTTRDQRLGIGTVQSWRRQFDTSYAAFYFPWLRVVNPMRSTSAITREIPPAGHVAGQYARTDLSIGVHKAPANAGLAWVQDVTIAVDDEQHGVLNPLGINAIRTLPGRGIRIFGARTVSSDPNWRYINIRRLLIMIEKAIYLATQWAVFEPNDTITQAKLRLSITSFLLSLWQRGALAGVTPDQAFSVRCDDTTNPPEQRDNGQLVALVCVAPVSPFEFVVVRVGRTANEFEITELESVVGAPQWQ